MSKSVVEGEKCIDSGYSRRQKWHDMMTVWMWHVAERKESKVTEGSDITKKQIAIVCDWTDWEKRLQTLVLNLVICDAY